jgi:hypothetical protein
VQGTGGELLAGAGLPFDQDRGGDAGDALDVGEDVEDRLRASDDGLRLEAPQRVGTHLTRVGPPRHLVTARTAELKVSIVTKT